MIGQRPEQAFPTSAYVALSSAGWCPSSTYLVHLSIILLVSYRSFPFVRFPGESWGDVYRLSCILPTFPAMIHFHLLTCSIMSLTFVFSLTQMFVFLMIWYVMFSILLCLCGNQLFLYIVGEFPCFHAEHYFTNNIIPVCLYRKDKSPAYTITNSVLRKWNWYLCMRTAVVWRAVCIYKKMNNSV